jgi:hypothetical protein
MISAVVGKRVKLGAVLTVFMYFLFRRKEAQLPRKPLTATAPISGGTRARICKRLCRLWSPGIDSSEPIPPTSVAWRAGTINRVVVPARSLGIDSLAP